MTSFNVMFKMFEPYFRLETKKARSSINKTAGNREAEMFLQSVYEIETVGSRILTKYIPPITMYLRLKARQPAVSFSASLPKLLE